MKKLDYTLSLLAEIASFESFRRIDMIQKILIKKESKILSLVINDLVNKKIEELRLKIQKDNTYDARKEIIDICLFLTDKGFDFGELYEIYGGLEPGKEKLSDETNNLINEVKIKSGDILNKS